MHDEGGQADAEPSFSLFSRGPPLFLSLSLSRSVRD